MVQRPHGKGLQLKFKIPVAIAGCLLVVGSIVANAADVNISEEYAKQVKSAEAVGTLGPNVFGDSTNFYTGSTEFNVTDVSLPGNNALPVRVGRRLVVGEPAYTAGSRPFSDWDLDIPYLQGVFSNQGWLAQTTVSTNRCSIMGPTQAVPPTATNQGINFAGDEFWSGNSIYIPGVGSQEMMALAAGNPVPDTGASFRWVTNNQWHFYCKATLANGTGEGFIALAPDGTRTTFDWMVSRTTHVVTKPSAAPMGLAAGSSQSASAESADGGVSTMAAGTPFLPRKEVRIFPTKVEDRFGNSVTYTYDAANPWRLTKIESSDGRILTLSYNAAGQVSTVSDGTRTWTYGYAGGLSTVTLPDSSQWIYALGDMATTMVLTTEEDPIT